MTQLSEYHRTLTRARATSAHLWVVISLALGWLSVAPTLVLLFFHIRSLRYKDHAHNIHMNVKSVEWDVRNILDDPSELKMTVFLVILN